jgi:hypothetical protein
MIAAKVDCTDVNDSFSSSNSEDFRLTSIRSVWVAGKLLGLWVFVFFAFGAF